MITVCNLTMTYKVPVREEGLRAAMVSLFRREYREIRAVQDISFQIEPGEVVGFIGPNGAGKTTTLKMLSGILYPTTGEAQILNYIPWRREVAFLKRIAMIRGSQPIGGPGELTVEDSLRFQQLIYELSDTDYHKNLSELNDMLQLETLLRRQVRALSLGEKMRCGLAHSLLYRPQVLFLDEPTIGLDVTAVSMVREFMAHYTQQTGATVLLTSHYMADVEKLCKRIILIDKGTLTYDGNLGTLSRTLSPFKLLKVTVAPETAAVWEQYGEVIEKDETSSSITLRVHHRQISATTARLLSEQNILDLSVENPPLESVIDQVYREGGVVC